MTANKKAARLAPGAAFQEENSVNSTGWSGLKQRAEAAGIEVRERNSGVVDCIRWGWAKRLHGRDEAAAFLASQGVR